MQHDCQIFQTVLIFILPSFHLSPEHIVCAYPFIASECDVRSEMFEVYHISPSEGGWESAVHSYPLYYWRAIQAY